jgi:hypothetical protein
VVLFSIYKSIYWGDTVFSVPQLVTGTQLEVLFQAGGVGALGNLNIEGQQLYQVILQLLVTTTLESQNDTIPLITLY